VPSCRELFVTVEAEAGECSYSLKVKHSSIKIVLTKAEISSQIQKMRRGWESRLHDLQREPAQREQFEEHILNLQESIMDKKRKTYGDEDFVVTNLVSQIEEGEWRTKLLKMKKKALQRCAQQDQAQQRRQVQDREKQQKQEEWLNRAEARRAAKEQVDRKRLEKEKLHDVQKDWLVRIALVVGTEKMKKMSLQARDLQKYLEQKAYSASVIHKFALRSLTLKRRAKLYTNVIKARIAFTAYARHARLGVFHATVPIAQGFLLRHFTGKSEAPSLGAALSRFKSKVLCIQRWWHGQWTIRKAYVEFFTPIWMELQHALYRIEAERQAIKEEELLKLVKEKHGADHSRQAPLQRRNSGGHQLQHLPTSSNLTVATSSNSSRLSGTAGASGQSQGHSPGRRRKSDTAQKTALERQKAIEAAQDQLPIYIVKIILVDYIRRMQKTYTKRVQVWEDEMKKEEFRHDLEGFGVTEDDHESEDDELEKPRFVYVDREEMQALVSDSLNQWKEGDWKEIRHNRVRLVKRPFQWWRRCQQLARQQRALGLPVRDSPVLSERGTPT